MAVDVFSEPALERAAPVSSNFPFLFRLISEWTADITSLPLLLLQNWIIVRVDHRKSRRFPQHEFLVLKSICHFESEAPLALYIRVERRPRAGSMPFLGRESAADDRISISSIPFEVKQNHSLYRMRFADNRGPNILNFAVMPETITALAPHYHLLTSSCYWFARAVFDGLAHVYDGEVSEGRKAHKRGKFAGVVVVSRSGFPVLGNPVAIKHWLRDRSAITRVETEESGRVTDLQELIGHQYEPRNALASQGRGYS